MADIRILGQGDQWSDHTAAFYSKNSVMDTPSVNCMLQDEELKTEDDQKTKEAVQYLQELAIQSTTEISAPKDDFMDDMQELDKLIKANDAYIKEIEVNIKKLDRILSTQELFRITNDTILQNMQNVRQEEMINQEDNDIALLNNSIISSLTPLYGNVLALVESRNKVLHSLFLDEISDWNFRKQQTQVGWPAFTFSKFLQPLKPKCERFAKILLQTYHQTQKMVDFFTKIGINNETRIQVEKIKTNSRSMLSTFLKSCFVVEKQSHQILPTEKRSSASLRLLLGRDFLSASNPPGITCSLHLEHEILRFYEAKFENIKPQDENVNNVRNNKKAFIYEKETDSFSVCFDKLSLNKPHQRKTKLEDSKTSKLVTDQKSCLMFQFEILIGAENFKIEAFSLPIVVTRNTSQNVESDGTIFWDNAFAEKNRKPFISPESVPFNTFAEALNRRWSKSNELELQKPHLSFLGSKLFRVYTEEELQHCHVTKKMFHKDNMRGWKFTFWSWFHKNMDLVHTCMLDEWRDGKIEGFIDKQVAEQKLKQCLVGTFLLRFSESVPGGITVAFVEDMKTCNHVEPWKKDDLQQISLSDSLRSRDLSYLSYLYPFTPKDDAFKKTTDELENKNDVVNPRYPKKARIRVVRQDDSRSATMSMSSSSQPSSIRTPSDVMMSGSSCEVEPFSPQSLLDVDPLLSQANGYHDLLPLETPKRMDEDLFSSYYGR